MFTSLVLVSLLPYVLADHDPCSGSWTSPTHRVNWTVKGDVLSFCVCANSRGWVGLGFSLDQFMPKSDVVVGAADNSGNSFVVDGYANSRSRPKEDASNDLQSVSVGRSGGNVTLCFTRKRVTGDSCDVSLDQCVYLLCAWNSRVTNYADRLYSYHGRTRLSSSSPVCFPNATICPPECPIEGQVYYGGDSCAPCDGTCKQPLVPCPLICRRGCGCPRGQVIDQAQNKCVALSECPKCEYNGQSYNPGDTFNATDGCNICHCTTTGLVICTLRACRPKKCEYNGQSYNPGDTFNATDGCNICTCSEGQVACTERACIPTCPIEGQRYFDIRNRECVPCQQTCGKEPRVCILICQSGCGCPVGQLIDPAQNKCVNSSDCTPECPVQGQIYYGGNRCAPCDGTCDRPLVPCPRICRRGCACPRGQVIDPARNRCVALSDCPPRCPIQGQRYFNAREGECVPCTGTCEDTNPVCTRECRSGCGCPTGTVLDEENNRCINPRTCPRECEYEGEVYQPGDRWDCSDSGKCMKCWCLANGVVANHTLGCPVTCTRSLCERNSNANCSIGCGSTSILTSCQACYYDDDVRPVPGKCRYKCGSNPSRNCLKKWGKCVKKRFNKKYGKARRRDRRDGLFKCATPTPCEE